MKIIFLDIDGVFNTYGEHLQHVDIENIVKANIESYEYRTFKGAAKQLDHWCDSILKCVDHQKLLLLHTFIAQHPNVKIVLSSSWRLSRDYRYMNAMLHFMYGFPFCMIGQTPGSQDYKEWQRGSEIKQWLDLLGTEKYPFYCAYEYRKMTVESYCIIDDDSDMLPEQMPHFIHVDGRYGLLPSHIEQIKEVLNEE